jgi:phage protein D
MGNELETENSAAFFEVKICGKTIKQEEPMGLSSILVEDHVDMIGVAEITIVGTDEFDWTAVSMGGDVEVILGGDESTLFKGSVTAIRHQFVGGEQRLTVQAMDPLIKLASSRVVKVYEEMSDSDIASKIISDGGCSKGTVDKTTGKADYVFQRNESNLGFLRRLAARNGYIVQATNKGKVDFKSAQFSGTAVEIPQGSLVSFDYSYGVRNIPKKLTVYGWDPATKKRVEGSASSGDIKKIGAGSNALSDLGDIWQGDSYISDLWVTSQDGASSIAAGELNRLSRQFLRGKATVLGNASLRAGINIKFTEQGPGFGPEAFVISTRHRLTGSGGCLTELIFCSNTYPK